MRRPRTLIRGPPMPAPSTCSAHTCTPQPREALSKTAACVAQQARRVLHVARGARAPQGDGRPRRVELDEGIRARSEDFSFKIGAGERHRPRRGGADDRRQAAQNGLADHLRFLVSVDTPRGAWHSVGRNLEIAT